MTGCDGGERRRTAPRRARFAFHRWDGVHQGQQLRAVVRVGAGQSSSEGNALRIRKDVVLRAFLAAIGRVRSGFFFAPRRAGKA